MDTISSNLNQLYAPCDGVFMNNCLNQAIFELLRFNKSAKRCRRTARLAGREVKPAKTQDQVFISNGKKFHDTWCNAVNGVWMSGSNNIKVVSKAKATKRGLKVCQLCDTAKLPYK